MKAVESWIRDFRHSARSLARTPGFTLTVVATLALAIGANASIFSVVKAVLLEPLPYPMRTASFISEGRLLGRINPRSSAFRMSCTSHTAKALQGSRTPEFTALVHRRRERKVRSTNSS